MSFDHSEILARFFPKPACFEVGSSVQLSICSHIGASPLGTWAGNLVGIEFADRLATLSTVPDKRRD